MKKFLRGILCLLVLVCQAFSMAFAGCSEQETKTKYNVIQSWKSYVPDFYPMSRAEMDEDIAIDGSFDEPFYGALQWLRLKKSDEGRNQTAEVNMTVRIAQKGLLIAAEVSENTPVTYNLARSTTFESGVEFYIGFGDGESWEDGLFEVDMTAGGRFAIRRYNGSAYSAIAIGDNNAPFYKVIRNGSILDGECFGYRFELFIPYVLFDRESRCAEVYVNTTHIAQPDWTSSAETASSTRNWYNFSEHQSSLWGWTKLNQGFTFDKNGAVIYALEIADAPGGCVTEEFGYDYCIAGDTVHLNVLPDEGFELSSFLVNDTECKGYVKDGVYSFTAVGKTTVMPVFTAIE